MNEILCFLLIWILLCFEKCCDVFCNLNEEIDKEKGENEWYFIWNVL